MTQAGIFSTAQYCTPALLGACTYISTGRKWAPINELRLTVRLIGYLPDDNYQTCVSLLLSLLGQETNQRLTRDQRL